MVSPLLPVGIKLTSAVSNHMQSGRRRAAAAPQPRRPARASQSLFRPRNTQHGPSFTRMLAAIVPVADTLNAAKTHSQDDAETDGRVPLASWRRLRIARARTSVVPVRSATRGERVGDANGLCPLAFFSPPIDYRHCHARPPATARGKPPFAIYGLQGWPTDVCM
jgi:hypothetical protein